MLELGKGRLCRFKGAGPDYRLVFSPRLYRASAALIRDGAGVRGVLFAELSPGGSENGFRLDACAQLTRARAEVVAFLASMMPCGPHLQLVLMRRSSQGCHVGSH